MVALAQKKHRQHVVREGKHRVVEWLNSVCYDAYVMLLFYIYFTGVLKVITYVDNQKVRELQNVTVKIPKDRKILFWIF